MFEIEIKIRFSFFGLSEIFRVRSRVVSGWNLTQKASGLQICIDRSHKVANKIAKFCDRIYPLTLGPEGFKDSSGPSSGRYLVITTCRTLTGNDIEAFRDFVNASN